MRAGAVLPPRSLWRTSMAFVGPKQCPDLEGKWTQGGALTTKAQRTAFAMASSLCTHKRRGQ